MVTRRSFIVRAFAGGMAAALPAGQVAAAIAPQSRPEPINIAPGVDVLSPSETWTSAEWGSWYQRTYTSDFGHHPIDVDLEAPVPSFRGAGETHLFFYVNGERQHETVITFMSHGAPVDIHALQIAFHGFMLAQASGAARAA